MHISPVRVAAPQRVLDARLSAAESARGDGCAVAEANHGEANGENRSDMLGDRDEPRQRYLHRPAIALRQFFQPFEK